MNSLSIRHNRERANRLPAISRLIEKSTRAVTDTVDYFVFFQRLEDSLRQWGITSPEIYLYGKDSTPLGKFEGIYNKFREKNLVSNPDMSISFTAPKDGLENDPDYIYLHIDGNIIGGVLLPGLSQFLGEKSTSTKKDIKKRIAIAFENFVKLANTHLDLQLASFDPLTGLNNRRSGADKIIKKINELRKTDDPAGRIALIDIDNFKNINDTHGHAVGDQVLVYLAQVIKATIQSLTPDAVDVRFGGEEFVIYFPNGTTEYIKYVILAILNIINNTHTEMKVNGKPFPFSASVGVSLTDMWAPEISLDSILDSMIKEADKAMYHVKKNGKDGVTEFHPNMQEGGSKYVRS